MNTAKHRNIHLSFIVRILCKLERSYFFSFFPSIRFRTILRKNINANVDRGRIIFLFHLISMLYSLLYCICYVISKACSLVLVAVIRH